MTLYHATYLSYLKSILKNGLGGSGAQPNWPDSVKNVVYLSLDEDVAVSYAESAEDVPDECLEQIVVIQIESRKLDKEKLKLDENVIDNDGSTLEYHGVISPDMFLNLKALIELAPHKKNKFKR